MTKLRKTATALILTAAMLLTGCAEQKNTPAPNAGTNNSSNISENDLSDSTSGSQNSTDSSPSDPESSSNVSAEPVPVEFTEKDRELQKILEGIEEDHYVIGGWLISGEPRIGDSSQLQNRFVFPESKNPKNTDYYYKIPENYSENGRVLPQTYAEIKDTIFECFSEQVADFLIQRAAKGSMSQNSDGTFSVILDEECKGRDFAKLIEIDGAMYREDGLGGKGTTMLGVNTNTAKVVSETDDTIEFTYISDYWAHLNEDGSPKYINDTSLYAKYAITGVLKYERGGWKRDWDK